MLVGIELVQREVSNSVAVPEPDSGSLNKGKPFSQSSVSAGAEGKLKFASEITRQGVHEGLTEEAGS